jgi:tetratricopeptide (TPR) repeat protein
LRETDQAAIRAALEELGEVGGHDARAAFMRAKAMEAIGDYMGAVGAYDAATKLDRFFRPASIAWGESLLMIGKVDMALAMFQDLLRSDPFDPEIRALLAAVWIEKNDVAAASELVEAAAVRAPDNSRVLEAQAQVLLCTGRVGEAFKLMDGMSEVGPFFAAKLNDLGIRLSQGGNGKSALALYQKAHRIVRPELRYKVSLNAALACRRMNEWDLALRYLDRCEQEYGGSFAKLEKIREAIAVSKAGGKLDEAG